MARLALAVAGAAIGSAFGMPGLGWTIGAMVGGLVDPEVIRQEGPRLTDRKVQFSTWGAGIPVYYGTMRGAGNVIWASEIRETSHTSESDGKGGPSVETTTYTYAADVAIALCEGEIATVRKIWADGRLLYDSSAATGTTASVASIHEAVGNLIGALIDATGSFLGGGGTARGSWRVYPGSETQEPDPVIEAAKGAGNVSAYRGLAYIVFENFQLADYGNRIPNFEFEVVKAGSMSWAYTHKASVDIEGTDGNLSHCTYADEDGARVYRYNKNDATVTEFLIPWDSETAIRSSEYAQSGIISSGLNNETFRGYGMGTSDVPGFFIPATGNPVSPGFLDIRYGTPVYYTASGNHTTPMYGRTHIFAKAGGEFAWSNVVGQVFIATQDSTIAFEVEYPTPAPPFNSNVAVFGFSPSYLIASWSTGSGYVIARYSRQDGSLVDSTISDITLTGGTIIDDDALYTVHNDAGDIGVWSVDTTTGAATDLNITVEDAPDTWQRQSIGYEWAIFARGGVFAIWYSNASSTARLGTWMVGTAATPAELADIVADQCARAGLAAGDLDVTALTDDVTGYAVSRPSPVRANIEPLQRAYFFDGVETDGKLKFVKRGGGVSVAIPLEELAAHEAGSAAPEPLSIRRAQEVDLPREVTVTYINEGSDYQAGTERAARMVTASKQQPAIELAIAMTPDAAARIADITLFDSHASRTSIGFATSRKYAKYLPCDVVTVADSAATYRLRLTKKEENGPLIRWEGVTDDATVLSSSASGSTAAQAQTYIAAPGPTRVEFLDIPILRDADNDAGLYVALGGYRDTWRGGVLYSSVDGTSFGEAGSVNNTATLGVCTTTLGNYTGGHFFDEGNTLSVTLSSGTLSSATADQVLSGSNIALVGSEIVGFKVATLVSAGKYTLSGLMRGLRGTDQHISTHAAGERFVLLSVAGILRPNEGTGAIDALRYFQGVSYGQTLAQATIQSYTNTAVGLMPFAPVHLGGGRQTNNDWIITWVRRTRIDGTWRNNVDAALGEASQSYEVDIMSGSTVKRTLTSATPTVTYTAAQQTTDFGGVQSTITVKVYQLSATVGRGFPATKTY